MGGFECATHIRPDGRRLDLLAATRHDERAASDYFLLQKAGVSTVRDGLRWNRIELEPGFYDWSSFVPMLRAAHETQTEVLWDLCHWGAPSWLDMFSPSFPEYFEKYARAAARVISMERIRGCIGGPVYLCPINEISFWSWIGGDLGQFAPFGRGRGTELKQQLVRATIRGLRAVREVLPDVRFLQAEPMIHIASATSDQSTVKAAHEHNASQFEAWDMIAGRSQPELGGSEDLLDILGVNYYWNNQWVHCGERAPLGHPDHMPLHRLLVSLQKRYGRPMLLTETGAEGDAGLGWLGMIGAEVRRARELGASVHGVCLYPVCDYPGWDDDRHVLSGLIGLDRFYGRRTLRQEFVSELATQRQIL